MKNIMRLVWILVGIMVLASFFPTRKSREFFENSTPSKTSKASEPSKQSQPSMSCVMSDKTKNDMASLKGNFVPGDYDKYCQKCTLSKSKEAGKLTLNCTNCQTPDKTACSVTKKYDITIPTVNIGDMV